MTKSTPIVVPRENVNDESATLINWAVAKGSRVASGQLIAQIETSKAVVDLVAPAAGVLQSQVLPGDDVPIGGILGWVVPEEATSPAGIPVSPDPSNNGCHVDRKPLDGGDSFSPAVRRIVAEEKIDPLSVQGTGRGGRITKEDLLTHLAGPLSSASGDAIKPARFSLQARELLQKLGLKECDFTGRGLIRSRDLLAGTMAPTPEAVVTPPAPAWTPAAEPHPIAALGVARRSEQLPRSKRVEAKALRAGLETTLTSAVSVICPTRGFRAAVGRQGAVGGNATAVIVAESARLLKKYPALNAFHDNGAIHFYESVNIGFAVDAGRGLKVPVIRDADQKNVSEIAAEMRDLVIAYLDDRLTVESLAGGTFTVTDLSGEGVATLHPLISRGQSAILGIGAEVYLTTSTMGAFNLVLSFDHQLSEGRTAARFLNELRERLAHYEATFLRSDIVVTQEPRCARCQSSYHELAANGHSLVQSIQADGSIRLLCKLCFLGWT